MIHSMVMIGNYIVNDCIGVNLRLISQIWLYIMLILILRRLNRC